MNITILDNRDVIINSSDNLGTQNENNASIINFSFPESLMNANKKIVFITDDGNYWDLITNNSYKITNAVSKYKNVSVYVWLVDEQNDIDFRSKIWNVSFNKNEEPDDIVPTEEEISGFDTMITQLNQGLEELDEEKIKLRREYEKVEEGLEDLDEALIQVNNVDIDASKTGNVATITITNKEGVEKSVQIEDGTDYVITQEDYQAIADVVEQDIADDIPTKTSDLENDSGFIDNTVNNLTNYTLKTNTGSLIDLEINSTTYVITLRLKDVDGNVISTDTVDLPLESVVVGGSYDSVNKKIVLTLENGNTVDILVGDLIAGLQTEITNNNKLASDLVDDTNSGNKFVTTSEKQTWNGKYNKPVGGIPSTDLSSAVQTSLGKADSALQEHQDISGKEDKSNKVTSIDENSTDTQYPSAKLLYDQLAEKQEQIDDLVEENSTMKKQFLTAHISTTSTQLTDSAEDLQIENVKLKMQTSQASYNGYQLWGGFSSYSFSNNDIDFVMNTDGSISMSGTASSSATMNIAVAINNGVKVTLPAGTYTISKDSINTGYKVQVYSSDTILLAEVGNTVYSNQFTLTEETIVVIRALVPSGTVINLTAKIMLEPGATAHDWEPFVGGQASPSPAYPQLIHRVTGECNERFQNKNLWGGFDNDYTTTNRQVNFTTYKDGTFLVNGTATGGTAASTTIANAVTNGLTKTLQAGTYTVSGGGEGGYKLQVYDISSNLIIDMLMNETSKSFTLAEETTIVLRVAIPENQSVNTIIYPQIEQSSTASTYIPHAEQNAPLSLGNIEAYEGDEIQIDFVQKAGYKKVTGARLAQNMGKLILNGSEIGWVKSSNTSIDRYVLPTTLYLNDSSSKCNYFIRSGVNSVVGRWTNNSSSQLMFNFAKAGTTTLEQWLTWLSTHNLELVQPLATPITTPITDPTLLAQFETLINMKTYKNITNIESTGADLAPVIDFEYYQDMSTIKSRIFSYDSATQTLTITI